MDVPSVSAAVVYNIPMKAAVNDIIPRKVRPEYLIFSQWVIMVPGCIIQLRIDMSAMLMPVDFFESDLRLNT